MCTIDYFGICANANEDAVSHRLQLVVHNIIMQLVKFHRVLYPQSLGDLTLLLPGCADLHRLNMSTIVPLVSRLHTTLLLHTIFGKQYWTSYHNMSHSLNQCKEPK